MIKKLLKDIREFEKDKPEGITLEVNEENIADIQASITGPGTLTARNAPTPTPPSLAESTPYEGGTFLVKLVLGPDFPAAAPRGA